jgi:hypothetical protein
MPTPQQVKAKEKAKAKALQAKADAKAANKAAAKPKTVGSNVKVVPELTSAERSQRNISESARLQQTRMNDPIASKPWLSKGPTVSIRTNPGISGAGGAKVAPIYKPMGGSGLGLLSIKNR